MGITGKGGVGKTTFSALLIKAIIEKKLGEDLKQKFTKRSANHIFWPAFWFFLENVNVSTISQKS